MLLRAADDRPLGGLDAQLPNDSFQRRDVLQDRRISATDLAQFFIMAVCAVIVAAIGALKGPLHGGANERVVEVLLAVGTPARADDWVREAIANKRRITGFGHRTCKDGDVRAVLLKPLCAQLAESSGQQALEQTADAVEQAMLAHRGLHPNVDWPVARLYHYLGLPSRLNPALFLISRIAGWCAHVMEQQTNNRLISPRAHYVGPAVRAFIPVEKRIKNESCAG